MPPDHDAQPDAIAPPPMRLPPNPLHRSLASTRAHVKGWRRASPSRSLPSQLVAPCSLNDAPDSEGHVATIAVPGRTIPMQVPTASTLPRAGWSARGSWPRSDSSPEHAAGP